MAWLGELGRASGHECDIMRRVAKIADRRRETAMSKGKNSTRKTVRMPATKFSHLQKKMKKNKDVRRAKKRDASR